MSSEESKDLKKWLGSVLSLVIMLIGTIWGITWFSLRAQVIDHETRLRTIEVETSRTCERLDSFGQSLQEIKIELKEMKNLLQKKR